jgi:hypothetical protein
MKTRKENPGMQSSKRMSFRFANMLAAALIAFLLASLASGQAKKPLTSDDLIQMKKAGFDDQMAINAIAANGVSLDTSVQGLTTLKSAGVSDQVINAALSAAAPKPAGSGSAEPDKGLPDEIGAYAIVKDSLTPLPVEIVNFKTAGLLGSAFTYGIKKGKVQGTVNGSRSSSQLTNPVMIVLRCPEGTAPTE